MMDDAAQFGLPPRSLPRQFSLVDAASTRFATVSRPGVAELAVTAIALILSTGAFINLFPGEQGVDTLEQGLLFAQIVWSILYLLMLFFIRKRIMSVVRLMWRQKLLVLLLGWVGASVIWSMDRQVTARHGVALFITTSFGVYLATRYSLRQQLRLVTFVLGVVISASTFACIFFPKYAVSTEDPMDGPAWQGVLSHKNNLGTLIVLTALVMALYFVKRVHRGSISITLLLLFCLVILTRAKTALVYFILGLLAFPFVRLWQKSTSSKKTIVSIAILLFGGIATWIYYHWESFVNALGKDPALSGRFVLWGLSLTSIAEQPFVGHGYDAFWSDFYGPAADIRTASGWLVAPHAHNGIINLWLDLGVIGVVLFMVTFVASYRGGLKLAKATNSAEGIWPVVFLTFMFIYSLTEINFMSRNDLFWILYVSMVFNISLGLKAIRQPQQTT